MTHTKHSVKRNAKTHHTVVSDPDIDTQPETQLESKVGGDARHCKITVLFYVTFEMRHTKHSVKRKAKTPHTVVSDPDIDTQP